MSSSYLQSYTTHCLTLTRTYGFLKINPLFFPKNNWKKKFSTFGNPVELTVLQNYTYGISSIAVLTLYRCKLWFNILDVQSTSITACFNLLLICEAWKHNKKIIIQVCCLNLHMWCYQGIVLMFLRNIFVMSLIFCLQD